LQLSDAIRRLRDVGAPAIRLLIEITEWHRTAQTGATVPQIEVPRLGF
jgi:hypothetical protein